jgi:hypothetical protein
VRRVKWRNVRQTGHTNVCLTTLLIARIKSIALSNRVIMKNGLGGFWKEATVACWPSIILEGQREITKWAFKVTGILGCVWTQELAHSKQICPLGVAGTTCLGTVTCSGPSSHPWTKNEYGSLVDCYLTGKSRVVGEKPLWETCEVEGPWQTWPAVTWETSVCVSAS